MTQPETDATIREGQLLRHLSQLFPSLDQEGLEEFRSGIEWVSLRGGDVLFHQGDSGDAAYLVISGRLRAVAEVPGGERLLNEVAAGETVGEMSLLSEAPRSATVYAARDTQLARLSREVFDRLTERHPSALRRIAGFVVDRLRSVSSVQTRPPLASLAVVPSRPGEDLERLAGRLVEELSRFGSVVRVDRTAVEKALGREGIADARDDDPGGTELVHWLGEQDAASDFVVYQADPHWTPWTERALRQTDHVLVVALAKHGPELGETERRLAEVWRKARPPGRSLVLLHSPGQEPRGTRAWLERRDVESHYHVRGESSADVARLARLLVGRGVGLVLGGGGARGFAHLGVLRALEEVGVPIDSVGGTSMGAIVGAFPAMGLDAAASQDRCQTQLDNLFDPTLPVVSLLAGRRIGARLQAALGEGDIEDLPIPFYCVSTNLSRAAAVVHRRGPLYRSVRSSISLPGILPPITVDGDLHVDGSLIDNLPIDTMNESCGGTVLAIDVSPEEDLQSETDLGRGMSGWRVLASRLNPFASRIDVPYISNVLMRSAVVASLARQRQLRAADSASLYLKLPLDEWTLLEFDALGPIAERGYEASLDPLRQWWESRSAGEI